MYLASSMNVTPFGINISMFGKILEIEVTTPSSLPAWPDLEAGGEAWRGGA